MRTTVLLAALASSGCITVQTAPTPPTPAPSVAPPVSAPEPAEPPTLFELCSDADDRVPMTCRLDRLDDGSPALAIVFDGSSMSNYWQRRIGEELYVPFCSLYPDGYFSVGLYPGYRGVGEGAWARCDRTDRGAFGNLDD